ncbi:MAG: argininosuccinate lyase, partial [Candidatus Bathyarchaeia archaeon]
DQVALDIRMSLRWGLIEVVERIIHLISLLLDKAKEHKGAIMPLYTHTQQAQVGTLSHYLLAYADALLRDLQRLDSCYKRVNLSPLGAGPIGGTSIPVDRRRTASLLGFEGLVENSIDAVSSKDVEIEVLSILANLMSSLSRISEDLILWSSSEFGYLELADEYSSTSSVMPQKKNPCTLELIRGRTGRVFGALNGILNMVKGLITGYNRDLQETKHYLWTGLDTVNDSLEILAGAIKTMNVNEARMKAKVTEGYVVALDLAESLVVESGLSFREAHMLVGNLIREMVASGIRMSQLEPEAIERLAEKLLDRRITIDRDFIKRIIDAEYSLRNRKSIGSPNPVETERMLKERSTTLKTYREVWLSRKKALGRVRKLLKETVKEYLSKYKRA